MTFFRRMGFGISYGLSVCGTGCVGIWILLSGEMGIMVMIFFLFLFYLLGGHSTQSIELEGSLQKKKIYIYMYVCMYVCMYACMYKYLRPRQPNGVMSSAVSLPNHTFTGQA